MRKTLPWGVRLTRWPRIRHTPEHLAHAFRPARAGLTPALRPAPGTNGYASSRIGSAVSTLPKARTAEPIAGATAIMDDSPAPADGMSLRSMRIVSITGTSLNRG